MAIGEELLQRHASCKEMLVTTLSGDGHVAVKDHILRGYAIYDVFQEDNWPKVTTTSVNRKQTRQLCKHVKATQEMGSSKQAA